MWSIAGSICPLYLTRTPLCILYFTRRSHPPQGTNRTYKTELTMSPGSTCELSCKAGSTLTGGLLTCDDTDPTENPDNGWRIAKGSATCTPEPDLGIMMAAGMGATAAVLVSGAVVIGIVICVSTSAAGAATASMLVMKKYGLVFYKDTQLETDTQLMMSTTKIHVMQAADLSLQDSVEHIVALLAEDEEHEDSSDKLSPRKVRFQTQMAQDSVKNLRSRLGSNVGDALGVHDVAQLRDRLRRSTKWSEDPERPHICAEMSNDEAAAIMLYTQGWSN